MLRLLNKLRKKGQSTLEYAILIIIILGALMSIQIYIKRGIQGRLKSATDDIGDQFSPGNTNVTKIMHTVGNSQDSNYGGTSSSVFTGKGETVTKLQNSDVMNQDQEFWQ